MNRRAGRRWLINALAVLIVLLLLWSCAAFRLGSASASALAFPIKLRSQISADYGPDRLGRPIKSLKFSIVEDVMRDIGLAPEEARQTQEAFELAMTSPVPTATLAPGELPPVFTPTHTASPTPTRRPTRTPTEADASTATEVASISPTATNSRTPTLTRTPTETSAAPSKTPTKTKTKTKTKTPSKTPAPGCLVDPRIELLGNPDEGQVYTSGQELTGEAFAWDPDNVHPSTCALDAEYPDDNGTGIDHVHFEIWKDGVGLVYEREQNQETYCAFTGNGPCQTFTVGTPNWPDSGGSADTGTYTLKARAWDGANWSAWDEITFQISLPPPSPTPTQTPTPTSTPTPTETPAPVCSLSDFVTSGKNAWWTLENGESTTIQMTSYDLSWPAGNTKLKKVKLDGSEIDNPDDNSSPTSASVNATFSALQASVLKFEFESDVQAEPYDVTVTFDNGCIATATVP